MWYPLDPTYFIWSASPYRTQGRGKRGWWEGGEREGGKEREIEEEGRRKRNREYVFRMRNIVFLICYFNNVLLWYVQSYTNKWCKLCHEILFKNQIRRLSLYSQTIFRLFNFYPSRSNDSTVRSITSVSISSYTALTAQQSAA